MELLGQNIYAFFVRDLNCSVILIGGTISVIFLIVYGVTKSRQLLSYVPAVWTSLGILGTFVAIVQSLEIQGVNFADIDQLVKNIIPAFQTSIIGIIAAIITSVFIKIIYALGEYKYDREYKQSAGGLTPELCLFEIYRSIKHNTEALESFPIAMQQQIDALQQEILCQKVLQSEFLNQFIEKLNIFYEGLYDFEKQHVEEITNRYLKGIDGMIMKMQLDVNTKLDDLIATHMDSIYKILSEEQAKLQIVIDNLSSILNTNVQNIALLLDNFGRNEINSIEEIKENSVHIIQDNSENTTLFMSHVQQEIAGLLNHVSLDFKSLITVIQTQTKENYDMLLSNNNQYCEKLLFKVESFESSLSLDEVSLYEKRLENTKNDIVHLTEELGLLLRATIGTMEKTLGGMCQNMNDATFALNKSSDAYENLVSELCGLLPVLEKLALSSSIDFDKIEE